MRKIKGILLIFLIAVLVYTRFVNISWGLPYPFHPDERNMANAIQGLNCKISNHEVDQRSLHGPEANFVLLQGCFNPHFFAYGQFPLYLGYGGIELYHLVTNKIKNPITYEEATLVLRIISAVSSILTVLVLIEIVKLFIEGFGKKIIDLISSTILILSPFFIQFSHFGTTESLLILLYCLIVYISLILLRNKIRNPQFIIYTSIICGLAVAIKISSLIFVGVPLIALLMNVKKKITKEFISNLTILTILTILFSLIFSPQNLISFGEFISAINYESDVATGKNIVFYTRQFINSIPLIFQFVKIFPFALGWPVLILFMLGFFLLPLNKEFNLLRLSFLIYFLPSAFLFAKWTRFMTPILPVMLIFAMLFIMSLRTTERSEAISPFWRLLRHFAPRNDAIVYILIFISILPGIAYLSIYQNLDVRFDASKWLYKDMKENSYILSETANEVDLPILPSHSTLKQPHYMTISFNFYDLDGDPILQNRLSQYLNFVDYIVIPSRRIFKNHPRETYPKINEYYEKLFSGRTGFKKTIEFTSYPKIALFGKTLIEFPDENAEETFTVFDHPVVRIYKKS